MLHLIKQTFKHFLTLKQKNKSQLTDQFAQSFQVGFLMFSGGGERVHWEQMG